MAPSHGTEGHYDELVSALSTPEGNTDELSAAMATFSTADEGPWDEQRRGRHVSGDGVVVVA